MASKTQPKPKTKAKVQPQPKPKAKPKTKAQIISELAEKAEVTKKQAKILVEELALMAYKEAAKGFTVPGIGKLVITKRQARMGRNPQTNEPMKIKAKRVLKFRIAKAAKDAVLS